MAEKSPSPCKNPLEHSIMVKIYPGQINLNMNTLETEPVNKKQDI